jgi:hypothetical protein
MRSVQEKLETWVMVNDPVPQPIPTACPTRPVAPAENSKLEGQAPHPARRMHTVGLGFPGLLAPRSMAPMPTRTQPHLADLLFVRAPQKPLGPPPMPIIPGTPPDRGYEADDEDDDPLAPLGFAQQQAHQRCARALAPTPAVLRALMRRPWRAAH